VLIAAALASCVDCGGWTLCRRADRCLICFRTYLTERVGRDIEVAVLDLAPPPATEPA
jgi:hypothetical protein